LLKGKKAIITGAGKGIGRSISLAYAENGADLCLVSRTKSDIDELASEIRTKWGTKVVTVAGDVSDNLRNPSIASDALILLGGVDILVCAAGYPFQNILWNKHLHELEDSDFQKVFDVDFLGSFRLVKGVVPEMIQKKRGVIILFSSTPAISGYDKGAPYTVAKSAVRGLVKEIASEYGVDNIRSYAIAPGNIKTSATFDNISVEEQKAAAEEAPMKRWGDPSEVASVCVVLASDNLSFVTGQTIVVDGGTIML
jgi:3-oxoacyl-[acyl-carrier protein] reductase